MDKDATQLELQLINIRHTSLIPALAEKKKAIRKKRKQRRTATARLSHRKKSNKTRRRDITVSLLF